jgi:lipopolysaccharide export LptBFGC system permease protein LptF
MTPSDLIPFALMAVLFPLWHGRRQKSGAALMLSASVIGFVLWFGAMLAGLILGELASQWAGLTW